MDPTCCKGDIYIGSKGGCTFLMFGDVIPHDLVCWFLFNLVSAFRKNKTCRVLI